MGDDTVCVESKRCWLEPAGWKRGTGAHSELPGLCS